MKKISLLLSVFLGIGVCLADSQPKTSLKVLDFQDLNVNPKTNLESVVAERSLPGKVNTLPAPTVSDLVTAPENVESVTYYLQSGEYFESTMNGFMNATAYFNQIEVKIDNTDIYIAGLFTYEPSSWIVGRIEDGKAIFASAQQCSDNPQSPGWLCGSDNMEYYSQTIEFEYNSEEGLLTAITPWIMESASPVVMMAYGYWLTPVFTKTPPPAPELVVAPANLETESFLLSAVDYDSNQAVYAPIKMGFDGNDVYIQGVSSYFPESWIKGTKNGNNITFPYNQYFGEVDRYQFFLNKAMKADVVFKYNSNTGEYRCQNQVFFIDNGSNYFESFANAKIVPINDEPAMPEDPLVYDIEPVDGEMVLSFEVSALDDEGNGLLVSQLYYQFYVDANGEVSPLVFTKSAYPELAEDMTEIPFGFTDYINFFPSEIYLKDMDVTAWERIGIKSIYKGGGEVNETEIQWRPLRMVTLPEDLVLTPYQLTGYDPFYDLNVAHNVLVGFYGDNEFYMKGFSEFFPNAVAKGTVLENGMISVPETFIAMATHILHGTSKVFLLPVDIKYDAEEDKFTLQDKLLTYSYVENTLFDELEGTTFTYLPNVAAVPANPRIDAFVLYDYELATYDKIVEYVNMPYMHMTVPSVDVEGNPMIQEELYYTIWIEEADGTVKQLVFDPNLYEYLPIELTLIPYTFTDYYEFKERGSEIYLNQNKDLIASWKKIGVQSVYFGGDVQNVSEIGWFNIEEYKNMIYTSAGVGSIEAGVNEVKYYDMQGRSVDANAKGMVIRQIRNADGRVRTEKIMNR